MPYEIWEECLAWGTSHSEDLAEQEAVLEAALAMPAISFRERFCQAEINSTEVVASGSGDSKLVCTLTQYNRIVSQFIGDWASPDAWLKYVPIAEESSCSHDDTQEQVLEKCYCFPFKNFGDVYQNVQTNLLLFGRSKSEGKKRMVDLDSEQAKSKSKASNNLHRAFDPINIPGATKDEMSGDTLAQIAEGDAAMAFTSCQNDPDSSDLNLIHKDEGPVFGKSSLSTVILHTSSEQVSSAQLSKHTVHVVETMGDFPDFIVESDILNFGQPAVASIQVDSEKPEKMKLAKGVDVSNQLIKLEPPNYSMLGHLKVGVIEVFAGLCVMSMMAMLFGAVVIGVIERDRKLRTAMCELLRPLYTEGDVYEETWRDWDIEKIHSSVDSLLVVAGPSCKAYSVAGYRGGASDVRAHDIVFLLSVVKFVRASAVLVEITSEFLTMNHEHGMLDLFEDESRNVQYSVVGIDTINDARVGGYQKRIRLFIHLLPMEVAFAVSPMATIKFLAKPVVRIRDLLLPVEEVPPALILKDGQLEKFPATAKTSAKHLFAPCTIALFLWGSSKLPLRVGSRVALKDIPETESFRDWLSSVKPNFVSDRPTFFVTSLHTKFDRHVQVVMDESFGKRRVSQLCYIPQRWLTHIQQSIPVRSIDGVSQSLRAWGQGLAHSAMLILDTRFSPPVVRAFDHFEKWSLQGLDSALYDKLLDVGLKPRDLSRAAGEAVSFCSAQCEIPRILGKLVEWHQMKADQGGDLKRSTIKSKDDIPVVCLSDSLRRVEIPSHGEGVKYWSVGRIDDDGKVVQKPVRSRHQTVPVQKDMVCLVVINRQGPADDASNWKFLLGDDGSTLPGLELQAKSSRAHALHSAKTLATERFKADPDRLFYMVHSKFESTVLHVVAYLCDAADELEKVNLSIPKDSSWYWASLEAVSAERAKEAVAAAITKLGTVSLSGVMNSLSQATFLDTGVSDLNSAATGSGVTTSKEVDNFEVCRSVEKELKRQFKTAAENYPQYSKVFNEWEAQVPDDLSSDIPVGLQHTVLDFDIPELAKTRFSEDYVPPKLDRLPRPKHKIQDETRFKDLSINEILDILDFHPKRVNQILMDSALKKIHDWVVAQLVRMEKQKKGLHPGPGEALAIGQSEFHPKARGIVWDFRELPDGIIKPLDMNAEMNTHFNKKMIEKEFGDYPDQELIGFWLDGVQWKVDLDYQIVLLPHLVSLPKGFSSVEKELQRLRDKGYYGFFPYMPFAPWRALPQGSTARPLEPDRWRRTTDGGAPRYLVMDADFQPVEDINSATNVKGSSGIPINEADPDKPWWVKEAKPKLGQLMNDIAILLYAALFVFRQPILVFTDDAADYFNQFKLCPAIVWLAGVVWLWMEGTPQITLPNYLACTATFVVEYVLGFGVSPNSNVCQRAAHALVHLFKKRFDAIEAEFFDAETDPGCKQWARGRRQLGQGQCRLYTTFMFTDDIIFVVVGYARILRALVVWDEICTDLKLNMAIPEKRKIGTSVKWLGFIIAPMMGMVIIPTSKLIRMLQRLMQIKEVQKLPFKAFRSTIGMLVHLSPWAPSASKADLKVFFNSYREALKGSEDDPVRITSEMERAANRWAGWLRSSQAMSVLAATAHFDRARPQLVLGHTLFVHLDAAKEGTTTPGFGGFAAGFAFHVPLPSRALAMPIPVLESVCIWLALQLFSPILQGACNIVLLTDATAAMAAMRGDTDSKSLTRMAIRIRGLRVFHLIREKLWFLHTWGEGHLLADGASRGKFRLVEKLGAILGFQVEWLSCPKALGQALEHLLDDLESDLEYDRAIQTNLDKPSFRSLEQADGLCTFIALAKIAGVSLSQILDAWRQILVYCGSNSSDPLVQENWNYLVTLKEGAIEMAKSFEKHGGDRHRFPGVPEGWVKAVLETDISLSPPAWILVVMFLREQPFGSPASVHLICNALGIRVGIFLPESMDLYHVGIADAKVAGVIKSADQHAEAISSRRCDGKVRGHISYGKYSKASWLCRPSFGKMFGAKQQLLRLQSPVPVQRLVPAPVSDSQPALSRSSNKIPEHSYTPEACWDDEWLPDFNSKGDCLNEKIEASNSGDAGQVRIVVTSGGEILQQAVSERYSGHIAAANRYGISGDPALLSCVMGASVLIAGSKLEAATKTFAWKEWVCFTRSVNTDAFRPDANTLHTTPGISVHTERDLYHGFANLLNGKMKGKRGCPQARPKSVWNHVDTVRRVQSLLGCKPVDLPNRAVHIQSMEASYLQNNPGFDLVPKRKEPLLKSMAEKLVTSPDGTKLDTGTVNRSMFIWQSYFTAMAVCAQTGARRDEVATHEGLGFNPVKWSWGHVTWCIGGVITSNPSHEQLKSMGPDDYVMLRPGGSKTDPNGEYWGQHKAYLPFSATVKINAARELRALALMYPSGVQENRRSLPIFTTNGTDPMWYSWLGNTFASHLKLLFSDAASNYSWHSWRIYLATSLLSVNAPPETIQALCRWKTQASLRIYARLGVVKSAQWLAAAQESHFAHTLASNIPQIDPTPTARNQDMQTPLVRPQTNVVRRSPGANLRVGQAQVPPTVRQRTDNGSPTNTPPVTPVANRHRSASAARTPSSRNRRRRLVQRTLWPPAVSQIAVQRNHRRAPPVTSLSRSGVVGDPSRIRGSS